MSNLRISDCNSQNIEAIKEIESRSSWSHWTQKMLSAELQNKFSYFKVAYIENKIIGYVIYHIFSDEAEILNLVIDIPFRGQKFGKQLLEYAIEDIKARKAKNIFLEVAQTNIIAEKLYQSLNFAKYAVRKNYYASQCAIMMKKQLS